MVAGSASLSTTKSAFESETVSMETLLPLITSPSLMPTVAVAELSLKNGVMEAQLLS